MQHGASAGALGSFLTPQHLFVFAVVTSISIPCAATLATLVAELGRRAAIGISVASVGLALTVGMVAARLLGTA